MKKWVEEGMTCMQCEKKIDIPFVCGPTDKNGVAKYRFCSFDCSQEYFWNVPFERVG